MPPTTKQCKAGVILYEGANELEYRCSLNAGHDGTHIDGVYECAWSAYGERKSNMKKTHYPVFSFDPGCA